VELGIEGRVALVMAASRGIGRGIAEALVREGVRVAIAGRSRDRIEEAAAAIGSGTAGLEADTDDLDRMRALPGEVAERLGEPATIVVLNTGGPPQGGALDNPLEEWEAAFRSLVLAPRLLVEEALPAMRVHGFGRIVNVGSSTTREPIPTLNLSNSLRLAAVGFLKTLSREVAADGVTVNTVATGRFATERLASNWESWEEMERGAAQDVPAGRLGRPQEYGDVVAFLCSERAGYLTGAVIPLDGGLSRSI
jgi:3-oxoacyl-[acyl-carrier protein] reductase